MNSLPRGELHDTIHFNSGGSRLSISVMSILLGGLARSPKGVLLWWPPARGCGWGSSGGGALVTGCLSEGFASPEGIPSGGN
jgi:pantoate kinase